MFALAQLHRCTQGKSRLLLPLVQHQRASFATTSTALIDLRLNTLPATGTQTKIVCTLGPATDTLEKIGDLVDHGMHVARLNFSHAGSDYTYPNHCMDLVRQAQGKHQLLATGSHLNLPNNLRAILVDTKGPEIRTGPLQGNAEIAEIEMGATVELTLEDVSTDPVPTTTDGELVKHRIHVDYQSICKTVDVGKQVLLDDGLIALQVLEIDPKGVYVICEALNGGSIKKNKGVNLPGMELDLPALTEKDKRDLKWACEVGADFVAASFIRTVSVQKRASLFSKAIASSLIISSFASFRGPTFVPSLPT
jgi:pyruvate kinase